MSSASRGFSVPMLAAGILGLTGVGLGAIGAHALKATLMERGMSVAWETAARYHLLHAVALLGLAAWSRSAGSPTEETLTAWTTRCWTIGVLLFSGSLYWLALGGPRWLGPVTPLGGLLMIAGWGLAVVLAFSKRI